MKISYYDGRTADAIAVSRTDDTMRVAIRGAEEIAEFRKVDGNWISADCDAATIEFDWTQLAGKPVVELEDCLCPPELHSRLLTMLRECKDERRWAHRHCGDVRGRRVRKSAHNRTVARVASPWRGAEAQFHHLIQ